MNEQLTCPSQRGHETLKMPTQRKVTLIKLIRLNRGFCQCLGLKTFTLNLCVGILVCGVESGLAPLFPLIGSLIFNSYLLGRYDMLVSMLESLYIGVGRGERI